MLHEPEPLHKMNGPEILSMQRVKKLAGMKEGFSLARKPALLEDLGACTCAELIAQLYQADC